MCVYKMMLDGIEGVSGMLNYGVKAIACVHSTGRYGLEHGLMRSLTNCLFIFALS